MVVIVQQTDQGTTIPIVSHSTTVIALTCQVRNRLEGNVFVLIQQHLQLSSTDLEIGFIETVRNVETKWAKAFSLLHNGMEEGQTEQQLLEDNAFGVCGRVFSWRLFCSGASILKGDIADRVTDVGT